MTVRAHSSMVIDLGACLGCHACTLACRRETGIRRGAEHAWLAHVEARPGPGWPRGWDDFELRAGRAPTLDDFGEPWTCDAAALLRAPEHDDRPIARRISVITGHPLEPSLRASHHEGFAKPEGNPSLRALPPEARRALLDPGRLPPFHLPRLCNQCLQPACASDLRASKAQPSAAQRAPRRGERSACPYLKAIPNWSDGAIERCDFCLSRVEAGRPPACVKVCGARFFGTILYDDQALAKAARAPADSLIDSVRELVLDPRDPSVLEAAKRDGVPARLLESAARSPVVSLVKRFGVALPLHPELRTLPLVFYVPPPMPSRTDQGPAALASRFGGGDKLQIAYLARLFAAGADAPVRAALARLAAARAVARSRELEDVDPGALEALLADAACSRETAAEIAALLASDDPSRRVVPPNAGAAR